METAEIRRRWLRFFGERGHTVVPSAPLLYDDPNLLFVNAGMVPFKPYFLGQETPPYRRATSVQKCVRTLDIEEVGRTTRHGTFFQMNGNFSFGDYFKEGAIELAWELITRAQGDGGFGFEESSLWVTVLHNDDEAIDLWRKIAGLPDERIVRRGLKDNYWSMGVPGPGGPCSEIYVDRGPQYGPEGGPAVDEDRFLEIWNLVFMQEELSAVRSKEDFDVVGELPNKNIDTGMGLERVAFLLQGVENLYEIDEVYPVIERVEELSGRRYGADPDADVRMRVIGDHVRSGLMLIGDGVTPSNEARGYVLRRLLRRAVRSVRLLGVRDEVLVDLLTTSKDRMAASYPRAGHRLQPDLPAGRGRGGGVRAHPGLGHHDPGHRGPADQEAPARRPAVRRAGLPAARHLRLPDRPDPGDGGRAGPGRRRGRLPDPDGPAARPGQGRRAGEEDRARRHRRLPDGGRPARPRRSSSPGTTRSSRESTVARPAGGRRGRWRRPRRARRSRSCWTAPRSTPRAAASSPTPGGSSWTARWSRCTTSSRRSPGVIVHRAKVLSGEVQTGDLAHALVDVERRKAISRSHTATHMVHKAIREALGDTATQAGSENSPGRFRFDFHANAALPASAAGRRRGPGERSCSIEDLEVHAEVMTQEQARAAGAMALFGEKYGDQVRVVSVGDWARELCGGTHARRSGQLGLVKLLGEGSIGSGVRRVEALVGADAYRHSAPGARPRRASSPTRSRCARRSCPSGSPAWSRSCATRRRRSTRSAPARCCRPPAGLAAGAGATSSGSTSSPTTPGGASADDLRALALDVRGRMPADRPAVVAVGGVAKDRPLVVVATNEEARRWGLQAGELVRQGPGDPRRRGRRQGRRRPGRRHRPGRGRRGAAPDRARRRRAGHGGPLRR